MKGLNTDRLFGRSNSCLLVLSLDHLVMLAALQIFSQLLVVSLGSALSGSLTLEICLHERCPSFHQVVTDAPLTGSGSFMERRLPCLFLCDIQVRRGHVVDEVLDDVFAAGLHGVMQQRAAVFVLQQEVRPLLVELSEPVQVFILDAADQFCIFFRVA